MEEKTLFAWLASFTCDKFGHPGAGLNWQKLWGESDHLGTAIIWETAMIWATAIIWAKAINSGGFVGFACLYAHVAFTVASVRS
jgi:hypothetical protein